MKRGLLALLLISLVVGLFFLIGAPSSNSKIRNLQAQVEKLEQTAEAGGLSAGDLSALGTIKADISELEANTKDLPDDLVAQLSDLTERIVALEGNSGVAGPAGAKGATGAVGATGPAGADGADGCTGDCVALQASTPGTAQTGNVNVSGTAVAGLFSGSGASLTSLNGTNISSGTVADARLSGNVALLNGTGPQTFTGNNKFTGTFALQNASNSTTAFQVLNATAGQLINVDTTNANITLNGLNSGELQAWSTNANALPAIRREATSIVANGYVYVIGGQDASAATSTVYYAKLNADGSTGAWSTNANALTSARQRATSVVANGYVYVMGGHDSGFSATSTVYYAKLNADGSTGAWSTNANALPAVRIDATSVVANGYVYVLGGANGSFTAQSTVYYAKLNADGSTGAWSTNANALPAARAGATSVVANGYVYVMSGSSTTVYYAALNADGSTGAWSTNANALPASRRDATSVVANGYVYVMGGAFFGSGTTVYYAALNADGSTGAWSTNANALPDTGRNYATSVVANGYVYVIAGSNGSDVTQSTVYYASTSRLKIGGSLDLVGLGGQNLADGGDFSQGSTGGSLTAGNTKIVGSFEVQGQGAFAHGLSIDKELRVGGSTLIRPATDTVSTLQIQNAAGTQLFVTDATNNRIYVGSVTGDTTGTLLVLDTKTDSGDPTGVNGGMYYNSNSGKFRCYENSVWKDCVQGNRVGALLRRVANQSIANNTLTDISWDTEDQDTDGFIAVTATTLTVPSSQGGLYAISVQISGPSGWVANSFYTPTVTIAGTAYRLPGLAGSSDTASAFTSFVIPLAASDTVKASMLQTTGSSQNFTGKLSMYRIGN